MKTFPVMLDVRDRLVVVIGAGPIGLRRVESLHQAGATVTLVTPDPPIKQSPEAVRVLTQPYSPEVIAGAAIVFACTNDSELNARIAADARAAGALVTVADQPADCDFFMPAVVTDGDVVVAVGTGGSAPALAGYLRDHMAAALPQRMGEFAAVLGTLRDEFRTRETDANRRMAILKALVTDETYNAFIAGGEQAVRSRLDELMQDR